MPAMKWFLESSTMNWAMTAISAFMVREYVARGEIYLAVAWAFMLGLWLLSAIYKTRRRKNRS